MYVCIYIIYYLSFDSIPPPIEPASGKAGRRNSTNGKIEMDSTTKDVSEQVSYS